MDRRLFAITMSAWMLGRPGWAKSDANEDDHDSHTSLPPGFTVPEALLQQSVAQRFPMRYPVPGLLNLDVQVPQIRLLPEQNRLAADMAVLAAGPALNRSHRGSFDVDFALRYESRDRTVRAHQLRLNRLRFPTLQPGVVDMLNTYAPLIGQQFLQEVVLHQLSPKDLAMADALNMQPGSITVTGQGLRIGLVLKPL
ncbi:MAG TPA: DUF1439 domain-containing protein [Hydrogenophaga sp.]|uniref:DUF1439 domain-containing protein n=1 Tax=Hydrogenophaga sp. TaxID=1904254 RepID=UPI002C39294D|nr:DUF1439 domain-containing protein [Hydrogenophaga sp.]HMN92305.1 DUF1439 domain-containing protein [Hydrogenophaga sp.]HMP09340.1 DUF1439 domain-containing protein [Hydrogenophaga sp.]